jgi:dipeptidyl-peptidase III
MKSILILLILVPFLFQCKEKESKIKPAEGDKHAVIDRFFDLQVLKYYINDFDKLSLKQKKLVYYLTEAGLCGRDIIYDQNNPYNLEIRYCLEEIITKYKGDRKDSNWIALVDYAKRIWFSNGIHHHYAMTKFLPTFSKVYFDKLIHETGAQISHDAIDVIFNPSREAKRKVKDEGVDIVEASANNFYGRNITQKMAENYYNNLTNNSEEHQVEYGLNSTLILENGVLKEDVWKSKGRYGKSIDRMIYWLKKAASVAENKKQESALLKLVEYYETGDLKTWDDYNVLWVEASDVDIDYIHGFVEVYGDELGRKGSFESMVQIKDFEASKSLEVVAKYAQWFEDNSPIQDAHKKKNVKGIQYIVIQIANEAGDASPASCVGVNLPNNEWIREEVGSKSISLGNIIQALDHAGGNELLEEFCYTKKELDLAVKYYTISENLHTTLHEVAGHASGKINKGIGQPSETLKKYASALEEARADLVGLYYLMDQKLVQIGLMPSLEVGKAQYDSYIRVGLMMQLQKIELGQKLEEEHMQNRQLIAAWVYEKGLPENVISKIQKDGKTYFKVNDYEKLRVLFGELLREIQRIKSEGDYEAGKNLIENYAVNIDYELHEEVLNRVKKFNLAPYSGFVNPVFIPEMNKKGEIIDVKISYDQDFLQQMLYYGKTYSFLRDELYIYR